MKYSHTEQNPAEVRQDHKEDIDMAISHIGLTNRNINESFQLFAQTVHSCSWNKKFNNKFKTELKFRCIQEFNHLKLTCHLGKVPMHDQ